ncbi:MAG: nitroreductase family protein [Kineosporiaceae bacterium]
MEFAEVLRRRRMVRRYDPVREVPDDTADRLLRAATRAPSAGFSQGVDLLVLRSAADRRRFWVSQAGEAAVAAPSAWLAGMAAAPLVVAVLSSPAAYLDRYAADDKAAAGKRQGPDAWPIPYWHVDAGMSALLILLAAVDEGLGACFVGLRTDGGHERFAEAFGVPPDRRCVGVVTAGYPAQGGERSSSAPRRARRSLSEIVHEARW